MSRGHTGKRNPTVFLEGRELEICVDSTKDDHGDSDPAIHRAAFSQALFPGAGVGLAEADIAGLTSVEHYCTG